MQQILVPIFVCVVLPVAVVLITVLGKMNADNRRAQIIIKAIEANNDVDVDKLAESMRRPHKSPRELLNLRLLRGCIFSLLGVALVVAGLVFINYQATRDTIALFMLSGGASLAVGVSYLVVYRVSRKQVDADAQ